MFPFIVARWVRVVCVLGFLSVGMLPAGGTPVRAQQPSGPFDNRLASRKIQAGGVQISPVRQGQFIIRGQPISFSIQVSNIGDSGGDTYQLSADSTWPVRFYDDRMDPLADSDDDGTVDTGPLEMSANAAVNVQLEPPALLSVGDNVRTVITAASTLTRSAQSPSFRQPYQPHLPRWSSTQMAFRTACC